MIFDGRRRSDVIARDCSLTPPHDGGSVVRIAALFLWMIDLRLHCGRPDVCVAVGWLSFKFKCTA